MLMFFICFFQTYRINDTSISVTLPDSGLIKGSVYSLRIFDSETDSFFVAILDSEEYSLLPHLTFAYASQFCSRFKTHFAKLNASLLSHIYEAKITLTIPKKDTYHPLIVACKASSSHYGVSVNFHNGDSLLDSRRIPSFIATPIELCILVAAYVPWIINQVRFKKGTQPLHHFITTSMFFLITTITLSYFVLWHDNLADRPNMLHLFLDLSKMCSEIMIFSTLILAAKGWCFVITDLKPYDIVEVVLFCSLYFIFQKLYSCVKLVVFGIILFALTSALLLMMWGTLVKGIQHVEQHILAHMMVIQRCGIDPVSTPIYKKHIVYSLLTNVIVTYFSCCIMEMSLELANFVDIWIKEALSWIINGGLLACLGWLFRIRRTDCQDYVRIDQSADEVNRKTIEIFEEQILAFKKDNLVQWEEGMLLPPQPILINTELSDKDEQNVDEVNIDDSLKNVSI